MVAVDDPPTATAGVAAGGLVARPRTPDYLRAFVWDLYGEQCLRCRVPKPLAVAHLLNWPTVRKQAGNHPNLALTAFWTFHQPANVVLLCCNCHTLLDNPTDPDVTREMIVDLRDEARASPRFGDCVRRFVCRELGSTPRHMVDIAGMGPLADWLEEAMVDGVLTEPYRFVVPWATKFWHVDLAAEQWPLEDTADPTLPLWNGHDFDNGRAEGLGG
jgi:hypothetical protein